MNTSKVAASNTMVVSSSHANSIVEELQKQKMQLTKQIEKVNAGSEDAKTKTEKIKALNDKIAELDKEIQQAKIEEQQREQEKIQQKNAEKAIQEKYDKADEKEKDGVVLSASLNDLLVANNAHHEVKEMKRVRMNLEGEMNVAQGQITHGLRGGSIKYQADVVSEKGDALSQLDGKIGKKMGEVKKNIDKSLKIGIAEAEKAQVNKLDKADETDGKKVDSQEETSVEQVAPMTVENNEVVKSEEKIDKPHEKRVKPIDILA